MKHFIVIAALALATPAISISAQQPDSTEIGRFHRIPMPKRPSTYGQVDSLRNTIGLTHEQFDKVYSAYDKYNKAVFGDDSDRPHDKQMGQGRGPGKGMGPGPGGRGMGGPRQGMGPRGNFGNEGPNGRRPKEFDAEKFEKTKIQQEEKLCKKMKKIFKDDETKYNNWLEIRAAQLSEMFSEKPLPPIKLEVN